MNGKTLLLLCNVSLFIIIIIIIIIIINDNNKRRRRQKGDRYFDVLYVEDDYTITTTILIFVYKKLLRQNTSVVNIKKQPAVVLLYSVGLVGRKKLWRNNKEVRAGEYATSETPRPLLRLCISTISRLILL